MTLPSMIYQGRAVLILKGQGYTAVPLRTNLHIDGKFVPVRKYKSDNCKETFFVGREYSAVTGQERSNRSDHDGVMSTKKLLEYLKKRFSAKPA